jgi:hypothetical protein
MLKRSVAAPTGGYELRRPPRPARFWSAVELGGTAIRHPAKPGVPDLPVRWSRRTGVPWFLLPAGLTVACAMTSLVTACALKLVPWVKSQVFLPLIEG